MIGSVGSYGASLCGGEEYSGIYPKVDALESAAEKESFYQTWHEPRISALLSNPDVDVIGVETVPRSDEAASVCKMLCKANVKPFYISFRGHDNG